MSERLDHPKMHVQSTLNKIRQRAYVTQCTRSRSISEVKQPQAGLVLGWVTAWEYPVPYPFAFCVCTVSGPSTLNLIAGTHFYDHNLIMNSHWNN